MENQSSDFEAIACPLCSEVRFSIVYPGTFPKKLSGDFLKNVDRSSSDQTLFEQVVRCVACGLVYLNPRLKPGTIVGSYAEGEDSLFVKQDAFRIRTFTSALKHLRKKRFFRFSKETKALDIGCAGGAFLRAAKNLGISAVGVEPSKWLGEYARSQHGLDVRTGVLKDQSFPEKSFDLITLWDVIEHVPDPSAELLLISKLLKPGGLLVVNYPDFGSLPARVLGRKWPFLLSVHLVYYTRRTIRKQLRKAGFRIIDIRPHWQTLELGYILKRAGSYFALFRFFAWLVEKLGLSSFPVRYWIGQTRVLARSYDS